MHNSDGRKELEVPAVSLVEENGILKSPFDKKHYKIIDIGNGLQALLVSDPSAEKAAAAMAVNVGYFSDPEDIPGLAHFCEHMLFLGTEKYPDENAYSSFLNLHGGNSNAYTAAEETVFYFDVAAKHLEGALDRFAQFFIAPLFTVSATDRELKAVDSEHNKNIQQDPFRLYQLEKSTSIQQHPYHKFATGNSFTLRDVPATMKVNVRERLLEFHETHYCPTRMKLSVVGNQSLDEIANLVLDLFQYVPKKTIGPQKQLPYQNPFEGLGARLFQVKPIKEMRTIKLTWTLPPLYSKYLKAPNFYISNLFGHEGPGSIFAYLKSKGWATSLLAGSTRYSFFTLFNVTIECTKEGIEKHRKNIIATIFRYILLLKEQGPQKWLFDEVCSQSASDFIFQSEVSSINLAPNLAKRMIYFPNYHVLTGSNIFTEYDPDLLIKCIECLAPDHVQIMIIDKDVETAEKERWYETEYRVLNLTASEILSWTPPAETRKALTLPPPNEFIPTDFNIRPFEGVLSESVVRHLAVSPPKVNGDNTDVSVLMGIKLRNILKLWPEDVWRPPALIRDTELVRMWFKQDTDLPKVSFNLLFKSSNLYSNPLNSVTGKLFVALVKDSLNEFAYAAEIAGLDYSIHCGAKGFEVNVNGFNHKAPLLLTKIVQRLFGFLQEGLNEDIFSRCKEKLLKSLTNWVYEQPYMHAIYYASCLYNKPRWHKEEEISALKKLNSKNILTLTKPILEIGQLDTLIMGNIKHDEANSLVDAVLDVIEGHQTTRYCFQPRVVQLQDNSETLYLTNPANPGNENSSIEITLQIGRSNPIETIASLELVAHIASEPFFNRLRTEKQLGYIDLDVYSLRFIVQSSVATPLSIDKYVEEFLHELGRALQDMSPEDFQSNIRAVVGNLLEKDNTLFKQSLRWWKEIKLDTTRFGFAVELAQAVAMLNKMNVLTFYNNFLKSGGKFRRKLLVGVHQSAFSKLDNLGTTIKNVHDSMADALNTSPKRFIVKDIEQYQAVLQLFPQIDSL